MNAAFFTALARSLMAGEQSVEAAHLRARQTLGRPWRWLRPFVSRYIAAFRHGSRPRLKEVIAFVRADEGFDLAALTYGHKLVIAHWLTEPQRMLPYGPAADWDLPLITTEGDLARWLALHQSELDWLSDRKNLCRKQSNTKLQHYRYLIEPKRRGGIRLIESPKRLLKDLQRRILEAILNPIPPHPAAHGFVKGRSIVTFASSHTGQPVVLRLDLENFFPSYPAARVQALFRTLGYPDHVADHLMGLCTTSVPRGVLAAQPFEERRLHEQRHLPQGAPTSPALANAMAYRLDCRLSGLARTAGAVYSRYADDLAFSGGEEFRRNVHRFQHHAAAVALEEGVHRQLPQDPHHAPGSPPIARRPHRQSGSQPPPQRPGNARSDPYQLPPPRSGFAEPRCRAGLPGPPRRPHLVCRNDPPGKRPPLAVPL